MNLRRGLNWEGAHNGHTTMFSEKKNEKHLFYTNFISFFCAWSDDRILSK